MLGVHVVFAIIIADFEVFLWALDNKTIIPLMLVGYEIVIVNLVLRASLAIYHLISNAPLSNNNFC